MADNKIEALIRAYLEDTLSTNDLDILLEELRQGRGLPELTVAIDNALRSSDQPQTEATAALADQLFAQIMSHRRKPRLFTLWRPVAAAAVLLLLIGGYFLYRQKSPVHPNNAAVVQTDLPPGHNGAVLTLSGGQQYILDSTADGHVASQGQVAITKKDGRLAYQGSETQTEILYNTLSTPRGRQYQLTLADGTRVWLNAASSLHFPTAFSGSQRRVELTGEAYFEVAPDSRHPFIVDIGKSTEVQVLGTHFNINAYSDEENWKTTLLEGRVKVTLETDNKKPVILIPGQQAVLDGAGRLDLVRNADVEQAVAWKNNRFIFDGNDIQQVMRQLARWYDVSVVYRGQPITEKFVGAIGRSENISSILRLLERTHTVSFSVEGHTVTVMPYTKK